MRPSRAMKAFHCPQDSDSCSECKQRLCLVGQHLDSSENPFFKHQICIGDESLCMDTKGRLNTSSAVRTQLSCLSLCSASVHFWEFTLRRILSGVITLTRSQLPQNIFPLNKLHIRVMKGPQGIKHICECHFWKWEQSTFR